MKERNNRPPYGGDFYVKCIIVVTSMVLKSRIKVAQLLPIFGNRQYFIFFPKVFQNFKNGHL